MGNATVCVSMNLSGCYLCVGSTISMNVVPTQSRHHRCQFIGPKGRWSVGSLVRRVVGPKGHWSEGS